MDGAADSTDSAYTVGDIAARSGITPATLRVWERRYGFPVPTRKPSGHRLYGQADLDRLLLIARALRLGLRAGYVVPRDPEELTRMLGAPEGGVAGETIPVLNDLVDAAAALDQHRLHRALESQLEVLGPARFAIDCLGPLLRRVGELWERGVLSVQHEHMVSEVVQNVGRPMFRKYDTNNGPCVVLATLPGEEHSLGTLIAGLVCLERGLQVLLLGRETPIPEIVHATHRVGAKAVGISITEATARPETTAAIKALRAGLRGDVELLLGGAGSLHTRRGVVGVHFVHRPDALSHVLDSLIERHGSRG